MNPFDFIVYPTAILNPIGQTVIEGTTLQLKCKFGGNPKPEISWEKDKKALKENLRRNVTNMKDSSLLNLINVTKEETGSYRCVARLKHITERTYEAKVVVKGNYICQKWHLLLSLATEIPSTPFVKC